MTVVVLAAGLVGCTDFVSVEGEVAGDDGGSSSATEGGSNPTAGTDGSGTTASSDSNSNTTTPIDPLPTDTAETADPTTDSDSDAETTTDPTTDSTSGTSGESDTDTGPSTTSDSDAESTTGPMECMQQDTEPNDTFDESQVIPQQPCDMPALTFTGTLEDDADIDRFAYDSPWDCGQGEPDHVYTVDGPVELCVSASCNSGGGSAFCQEGTVGDVSGFDYCCGTGTVRLDLDCDFGDESAVGYVVIRPDQAALECADYSFTYEVQPE